MALALMAGMGAPAPARAEWLKAESRHFVVYSDGGESGLRAYVTMLEDFDGLLRLYHGRAAGAEEADRKLDVYLVRTSDQLRRVYPDAPKTVAGFYSASMADIFAVAIRKSDGLSEDTVLHEYVHHFMLQHYPGAYPAWLVEGYAEYFMTAEIEDRKILVGSPNGARVSTLLQGGWIPARDLLTKRSGQLSSTLVGEYYAQSWLLTHYMISEPERRKQLSAYLSALGSGEDALAAWTRVVGYGPDELDRRLKVYLRSAIPTKTLPRAARPDFPMTVSALPPSATDLLLENQQTKRIADKAQGERLLAQIRADAKPYPNDRLAVLTLARAEAAAGDAKTADTLLEAWLRDHPDDAEALRLAGERSLDQARDDPQARAALLAQAARYFGRANKAEPDSYQTLYGFARTRAGEPGYPSDNTLNVLELAAQLAPQVKELRLTAGQALISRGRLADALRLIEPVAADPHGGKAADIAEGLLKTIRERMAAQKAKG
ncbi:DUF1570 domain-containing protein [Caulobacter sp. HMWF025]|uniref:DUF1570 domain-containing protein n=2 Tax=unclassified Caulobacter TaxID=2648921 RepID=UPI000D39CB2F|nr:DUF1570 domain-containing protein [Caulobacter sp. HMWF025]PTT12360.1 hypothetical protein DBR10_01865 [Caulobacter sp. HMWF025]